MHLDFKNLFPISPSLFFNVLLQAFIKHSRKASVYIYVNSMNSIHTSVNLQIFA